MKLQVRNADAYSLLRMSQSATNPAVTNASKRVTRLCSNCGAVFSDSTFSPCCLAPLVRKAHTLEEAIELLASLPKRRGGMSDAA